MTFSTSNQLPYLTLPLPIVYKKNDEGSLRDDTIMSKNILLPPILTTNHTTTTTTQAVPSLLPDYDSPSCSFCSSSLPSSPETLPASSFPAITSSKKEYYSIQSLLNSSSDHTPFHLDKKIRTKKKMTRYVTKQIKKQQQQQQPTKGLRLFSKQVCDKVAERGVTTYNEVADELTAEIRGHGHDDGGSSRSRALVDQKNIRRRVYDALNVLMAMNIITKDRKQIKWLGIPTSGPGLQYLKEEIQQEESRQQYLLASIQNSTLLLDDTLRHLARLKHLIQRNHQRRYTQQSCHLPFFIVTSNQPIYTEELSRDGKQALLNLGSSWMIKQDRDVLAKLWPGTTTL